MTKREKVIIEVAIEIDRLLTNGVDIHPNSSIHEKLNQALRQNDVKNCIDIPEWFTDEIRVLVKTTWNGHNDFNDNKRVEAMRIIQKCALDAGYTITIKKSMELLHQYCL